MSDFREYFEGPVDLGKLIKKLKFTEEDVEHAALEQPTLFLKASRFRVQKMRKRVDYNLRYDSLIANVGSKFRENKDEKGKRSLTEGAVKEKIQRNDKVKKLRRKMEMSFVEEKASELLVEAYRQRKDVIKIIIDARWAEAGSALRKAKEDGARKMSSKLQKEVRERFRGLRSGDSEE